MRSPDKQRFWDAVNHIEREDICIMEVDADISHVNKILGKEFPLSIHAYELPGPDNVELNARMGNDLIYFNERWNLGRKQGTSESSGDRVIYMGGTMKTRESLKDIAYLDLAPLEKRLEETVKAAEGTGLGIMAYVEFSPKVVNSAMGPEDYWINVLQDPQFVHDFQRYVADHCMKIVRLCGSYGVDAILTSMLVGSTQGLICSPKVFNEFYQPLLCEHAQTVKESGMITCLHIDGNIQSLIPGFIDAGVDVLHPIQPCNGLQNIYELKEKYGEKITFMGNMDVYGVMKDGTPEDVRQDTIDHIDKLAVGGGYIVGSSHNLAPEIPLENFYAMRDAAHEYRYPVSSKK